MTVRLVEYLGWKGALELRNDAARVVAVPEVGRIMHYGFSGGENVLWVNPESAGAVNASGGPAMVGGEPGWISYGGDRIWPTEEDRFEEVNGARRPPDYFIDGIPWAGRVEDGEIVMTSPVSEFCGARVIRRVSLDGDSARVTIRQTLEKVRPGRRAEIEPIPLTLWNISTMRLPEQIFFPLNARSRFPGRFLAPVWPDAVNHGADNTTIEDGLGVFLPAGVDQKVGADAPGWIAAIVGDDVFAQFFRFDPEAAYPDGGTSATGYLNPRIGEIECLSPMARLKPGESLEHAVRWDLGKVAAGGRDERRAEAARWIEGGLAGD